jgi:glyoxylase-like metal-dependent hydrolase (beta-lactamase superfamily II)
MRYVPLLAFLFAGLIARSQSPHYQVYAIKFASPGYRFPIASWALGGPENDSVDIDFMVWLIKGDNGRNVLVDAGFRRDMIDFADAKGFAVVYKTSPDSALGVLGVKAGDITDIILSHPHWDHIDGISLFPNAHIWIQKEDYNYFVGGAWQKGQQNGGYEPRDVRALVDLNMAQKVTLVDGDNKEVIPGIRVFTGSRHTYNSQYVLVSTPSKKIVLASDNIWIYYSLEHLSPPSEGGTMDTAGYVNAMRRMKTLATSPRYIIPGHDAKVFSLFPRVADGVVKIE